MTDIKAIDFAIDDIVTMHGSVTGDPEHKVDATKCNCVRGRAIRRLKELRIELTLSKKEPSK